MLFSELHSLQRAVSQTHERNDVREVFMAPIQRVQKDIIAVGKKNKRKIKVILSSEHRTRTLPV
jgi:hypothetical protein